ncbi:MAG TPA: LysR family transcriptional regulator [Steroidobacteraceae bacterium]|jgi:DNA-binding transcriptional LysR family regulator|nr:LysR family transcriptional regulator [Steroidobacteraceae bacterium]
MRDLNDLYYFVQVVEHGGFAPAGRALSQPKSKLSRRIALLEERLGVRLIQRSTRHFSVTEIGQNYYAHCKAMLVEADAAQAAVEHTRAEPSGTVRLTCPVALLHARVSAMLAGFMVRHPNVVIHLEATNRRVDLIAEGIDVAIRARPLPIEGSDLMLKILAQRGHALVASPDLVKRAGSIRVPADLNGLPSLDLGPPRQEHIWKLEGASGAQADIRHQPRLVSDDMIALRRAAIAGVGIVHLPLLMVSDEIREGKLMHVLPGWAPRRHVVHAVYPSKRGLLPSVRALLDYLSASFTEIRED